MSKRMIDLEQVSMALSLLRAAQEIVKSAERHAKGSADVKCVAAIRALAKSFDVVDEAVRVETLRRRDIAEGKAQ